MINPHWKSEEHLAGHYPNPVCQFIVDLLNVIALEEKNTGMMMALQDKIQKVYPSTLLVALSLL
jgi:hypothetical protein